MIYIINKNSQISIAIQKERCLIKLSYYWQKTLPDKAW